MKLSTEEYDTMSSYAYQYGSKKYATGDAMNRFMELF